jgi:hypothetical protein
MSTSKRRRHTPERVIRKLAEGNKHLGAANNSTRCAATSRSLNRPGIARSPSTAA